MSEIDWEAHEAEAAGAIAAAASTDDLEEVRVRYLGRKSDVAQALRGVRDRESGMLLNGIRTRLEAAVEARERALADEELDRRLRDEVLDVTLPGEELPLGSLHPITQVRRAVEDAFLGLGYEVRDDREVETVHYNFDQLAFDQWHPARSPRASFFFDENHVLRTETSPSQIHAMEEKPPPIYMVSLGRCYRRDAIDATHYPIFHQFEGLAVDRGLTLADLKGTLLHVMRTIFGPDRRVRFRTHYFPFTEPSMEPGRVLRALRRRGLPRVPVLRAGSRWAAPAWSTRACSRTSGSTPRSGADSRSAAGSSASRSCGTTSRTSAPCGRATSAC